MATKNQILPPGVAILGPMNPHYEEILSYDAVRFLAELHNRFEPTRRTLLQDRVRRQQEISQGKLPNFLPETQHIRESDWKVATLPKDLLDRRVEITGPVSRKMVINAFNSGAKVFMADFEDSNAPTWANNMDGQINMKDAVRKTINFVDPSGKKYNLKKEIATLMVRPRGWHLDEAHLTVWGKPMSGSLFDFGLYFFHNTHAALKNGSGPYFYLPKMESHKEARLWNDVFVYSQNYLGVPIGTIKATCLIETILGAFEMDEILYELRDHSAGLNCGRWDYIFSYIKKFFELPEFVIPDRAQVTMIQPFMNAYVQLLIKTCHRRGVHAMGGMAAQIPIRNDDEANKKALEKVTSDKLREVKAGHDGTWVAHPGLVDVAMKIFNEHMKGPNQINVIPNVNVTAKDLLAVPTGTKTVESLRNSLNVSLIYLEAWIRGNGCVPIHNLMEDLATAEIARSQIQQWLKHKAKLDNGSTVSASMVSQILEEEVKKIKDGVKESAKKIDTAKEILSKMLFNEKEFGDFMSTIAYPYIVTKNNSSKL